MAINNVMGMFAKSPIILLRKHADKVSECCNLLLPFFDATNSSDWEKATIIQSEISKREKEADSLKREVRLNSPKGLFLPVNRADMLDLVRQQDKLANIARDISGRTIGRKLEIPKTLYSDYVAYLNRCLDAANQSNKVINSLYELLETGFKGREVDFISELIGQLDKIEDDTDFMQINLRHSLLQIESEYNPIDVIFLYENIKSTGAIADQAQRVGTRLEIMTSRT